MDKFGNHKLIIDNSRGILVDYKTDNINESNIISKIELYKNQLMFYAKMIFDRFPKINDVEIKLIFLNDLTKSYSEVVKRDSNALNELENNLKNDGTKRLIIPMGQGVTPLGSVTKKDSK